MFKRPIALLSIVLCVLVFDGCQTTVQIIEYTAEESETTVYLKDVPCLSQFPEFPAGCESTCAVMALQYAGEDITIAEFVDTYLKISNDFYYVSGELQGPDPFKQFTGDPRKTAYGCMAPVIEDALVRYWDSEERVHNATGATLDELCEQYIDRGVPVLTWVTVDMKEVTEGESWILQNGETYTWPHGEHCMLLVGYTDTKYIFHDPYTGKVKRYKKALAAARYTELGKQAIAIT